MALILEYFWDLADVAIDEADVSQVLEAGSIGLLQSYFKGSGVWLKLLIQILIGYSNGLVGADPVSQVFVGVRKFPFCQAWVMVCLLHRLGSCDVLLDIVDVTFGNADDYQALTVGSIDLIQSYSMVIGVVTPA